MKLRIKGNSVRLRVTRSELARLGAGEAVAETTHFGPSAGSVLAYSLASDASISRISVSFACGQIQVRIPVLLVREWCESDMVGIHELLDVGCSERLEISVEKDYACLDRSAKDNEDAFENPRAAKAC